VIGLKAARAASADAERSPRKIEEASRPLDLLASPSDSPSQAQTLRPYQVDAIGKIERAYDVNARAVYVAPTGSGKGEVIARVIEAAVARGERPLAILHRAELIGQTSAALRLRGVEHGVIAPGHPASLSAVQVASVATFARRTPQWCGCFDLIVIDEAHHAVAGAWGAAIASQPKARILGFTATPERLDGRGLREIFDRLIVGPGTADLIAAGYLAPFTVFEPMRAPDLSRARIRAGDYAIEDIRAAMDGAVIAAAVTEYRRICPSAPAVVFCVDRAHSEAVAERFRAAGVAAQHVDGETPATERRRAIEGLDNGTLNVLCNCGLISEGVDVPRITAAILLRPTQSLALYLQQVGRALRPSPGKERALILDFAGNTVRHGMPDESREWTLDAHPRRKRGPSTASVLRRRSGCGVLNRAVAHACSECGADLRTLKERREIEMRLRESRRAEAREKLLKLRVKDRVRWAGDDERRLRFVAEISGFKPGWVYYRLLERRALLAKAT
jgi:DNA repair protein RadD